MSTVVMTVIGPDRPGLVDRLSALIAEQGGNWERSEVARLADRFAGVVVVTIDESRADSLIQALAAFDAEGLLHVTAERSDVSDVNVAGSFVKMEVTGHDRPGIVQEISHVLALAGVSIERLETDTLSASQSAELLFSAKALLAVPPDVDQSELRESLESLSNELMIDFADAHEAHTAAVD
ncbi:MAG: glycine cleavage system protein R [Gammaproteobacteria bacterium]